MFFHCAGSFSNRWILGGTCPGLLSVDPPGQTISRVANANNRERDRDSEEEGEGWRRVREEEEW